MYNLVLIDDEPMVVEGMRTLVPWEKYQISCVGTYYNGVAGFEGIMENAPQIVITDIKMPGMSGLSLIEKVKSIYPKTLFVIISAYSDFQFAQKAISLDVVDYLLKPITLDKIESTLEKLTSILRDQEYMNKLMKMGEEESNRLIFEYVKSGGTIPKFWLLQAEHAMNVVICQLEQWGESDGNPLGMIKNRFEFFAKGLDIQLYFHFQSTQCILVLAAEEKVLKQYLSKSTLQEIKNQCNQYQVNFSCGIGDMVQNLSQLPSVYMHAVEALKYSLFTESLDIIYYDEIQVLSQNEQTKNKYEEQICFYFKNGKKEEFIASASKYTIDLKNKNVSPDIMNHYLLEVMYACLKIFKENDFPYQHMRKEFFIPHLEILKYTNYSHLHKWFLETLTGFYEFYWKYQEEPVDPILTKAIAYIHTNYQRDIGLFDVAEYVNMNASYFSVFFKSKRNISFIKYLTNVRIDMACGLLQQGEKVYNVSTMVGYPNYRYFCELFKKCQGVTPQQYKIIHSKTSQLD